MALGQKQQSEFKWYYLQIRENQIVESRKDKPDDTWVKRELNNPSTNTTVTKYYKFYQSVTGIPHNLFWYSDEGSPYSGYKLSLKDGNEIYQLDIANGNYRLMDKFCQVAENIDWNSEMTIKVFPGLVKDKEGNIQKNKDGSDKYEPVFLVYQHGSDKPVKRKYTKDNPVPEEFQPVKNKKTGKWNFDKYQEFMLGVVDEVISKNFAAKAEENVAEVESIEDDEDIPF